MNDTMYVYGKNIFCTDMNLLDSPADEVDLGCVAGERQREDVPEQDVQALDDQPDQEGEGFAARSQQADGGDQLGGAPVLRPRVVGEPQPTADPSRASSSSMPRRSRRIPTPEPPKDGEIDENDPFFRKKVGHT